MSRLAALFALLLPATASAQEVTVRFLCDLEGAPGVLTMGVHYQTASDYSADVHGNISGVFPVGVTVYVGGELRSQTAYYTFRGENNFADFVDHGTGQTFLVEWVLDGPRNGVWMKVNPFGGTTAYFCAFQGAG